MFYYLFLFSSFPFLFFKSTFKFFPVFQLGQKFLCHYYQHYKTCQNRQPHCQPAPAQHIGITVSNAVIVWQWLTLQKTPNPFQNHFQGGWLLFSTLPFKFQYHMYSTSMRKNLHTRRDAVLIISHAITWVSKTVLIIFLLIFSMIQYYIE